MEDEAKFGDGVKAVVAAITAVVTGIGGMVGLPPVVTPDLISLGASAVTAIAAVYFYIKHKEAA